MNGPQCPHHLQPHFLYHIQSYFYLTPDVQMSDIEGKTVLSRAIPMFQIARRGKCLLTTDDLEVVHKLNW